MPFKIGIDFDNTIACYDGVFHTAARTLDLIPADLSSSKTAVRDYLNGSGRKDAFTELQGLVYGTRMDLAALYPGVGSFIAAARQSGHEVFIVSHKTKHPMLGPRHDLHAAALGFLNAQQLIGVHAVPATQVFFELTKDEKIARIRDLGLDVFIDDLPEILAMPGFPPSTRAILFDPDNNAATGARQAQAFERYARWDEISHVLLEHGR